MASLCFMAGRLEAAVRYSDAGQGMIADDCGGVPYGIQVGLAYSATGQPERAVECFRAQIAHGHDTHTLTWAALVLALALAGQVDEARTAAKGLIEAAEATHNPSALSYALMADGFASSDTDPGRARAALGRGLVVARDSGNRNMATFLAVGLARLETNSGDPLVALELLSVAIRNYHDSGNTPALPVVLAALAVCLDRLGRYQPAATIPRVSPLSAVAFPEVNTAIAHLREVLGDQTYESLARKGETMTTAAMVTYAYDQIDQARAELTAVSK